MAAALAKSATYSTKSGDLAPRHILSVRSTGHRQGRRACTTGPSHHDTLSETTNTLV